MVQLSSWDVGVQLIFSQFVSAHQSACTPKGLAPFHPPDVRIMEIPCCIIWLWLWLSHQLMGLRTENSMAHEFCCFFLSSVSFIR